MLRRHLLTVPAAALATSQAPAQQTRKTPSFRLSARVEHLFRDLPLEQQMHKVAEARYHGYEFGNWRAQDPAVITKLQHRLGLECACIVGNLGANGKWLTLTDRRDREGFLSEIRAASDAALRFEARKIVVLTGNELTGATRAEQHASIVEGLKAAHDIVAARNVTMLLEVLNTKVNHKGYYLDHTAEAFQIVREVDSPFLKILFDIYHVQIMDGNLIATIRDNIQAIGHFHVADVPGRQEPGTGEINYLQIFKAIHGTGFHEFVAMEYDTLRDPLKTLVEVRTDLYEATA